MSKTWLQALQVPINKAVEVTVRYKRKKERSEKRGGKTTKYR